MIYQEKEYCIGDFWYSFCVDNLGKKYEQWLVPCRLLELSPAEYILLLVNEYNATVNYTTFFSRKWENQADEAKWRNFINKKAREKNFHI